MTGIVKLSCVVTITLSLVFVVVCFTGLRNGVVLDVYWNIWSLLVLNICEDLLYASYEWEGTKKDP